MSLDAEPALQCTCSLLHIHCTVRQQDADVADATCHAHRKTSDTRWELGLLGSPYRVGREGRLRCHRR